MPDRWGPPGAGVIAGATYCGTVIAGQAIWVTVVCHDPTTGEESAATVTGYYQRMTGTPGAGTALSFSQFNSETGVYYAPIDTTGFTKGTYAVLT